MLKRPFAKYPFVKYHGAGNEFLLIDDRSGTFSSPIPPLCDRQRGLGADGVLLLQQDPTADFRLRIFNSDGSEAASCGNGLRCLMKFLADDLGLPRQKYRIATGDRTVVADYVGDRIAVEMGTPHNIRCLIIDGFEIHTLDTGVPHAVLFVPDVRVLNVQEQGAKIRHHSAFLPHGTNVNFATVQKDGSIHVRTFERGLERETAACGTGAAAVAFIAAERHQLPNPIQICFSGGDVEIHITAGEIVMIGEAVKILQH